MRLRSSGQDRPVRDHYWRAGPGDVLTTVMEASRLRSGVFCRSELRAPWSLALAASAFAHFHVVERGGCWLRLEGQEPVALAGGDLVVVPHGTGHALTDSPKTRVRPLEPSKATKENQAGCAVLRGGGEGPETSASRPGSRPSWASHRSLT